MKLLLVLLPFLLLEAAAALDCKPFEGDSLITCNEILQSNLSTQEKSESILALMSPDAFVPDFAKVEQWNSNISFSAAPQGVPKTDSNYIKDAWLKVLAVMPSVAENGVLLAPSEGKVLSGYGFRIELPSSVSQGDCKTYYTVSNSSTLDVYSNSAILGHSLLVPFNIAADTTFRADLNINVEVAVDHYRAIKYCCDSVNGICTKYCSECAFNRSETFSDSLHLIDTLNATFYQPQTSYSLQAINNYYNTTAGRLNFTNFTAIKLNFANSSYEKHYYTYKLNSSYAPYDILHYNALPQELSESSNLNVQESNGSTKFITNNVHNCQLELRTHFSQATVICNLDSTSISPSLTTDKLAYYDGETIQVAVTPSNTQVTVTYANSSVSILGKANFTASYPFNRITLSLGEATTERIIAVQRPDELSFLFGLSIFSGMNYLLYGVLRKFWSPT